MRWNLWLLPAVMAMPLLHDGAEAKQRSGMPVAAFQAVAVGDRDVVVTTSLPVPRPSTRPCVVPLFERREFRGEAPYPIAVTAPAACPGPWAKIVLEGDFDVTAGTQFDRTARIVLNGANLFTGTTMEPRRALAPRWQVARDITDYAAVFATPVAGEATLINFVDGHYDGRIAWTARLLFYPADATNPAPRTPDIVEALAGGPVDLTRAMPSFARTVTWPRNIERMAIDVLAQPQRRDEFWVACQPAAMLPAHLRGEDCGQPFRETEIRIDGTLVGLAPVYPWIFTGGMGVWNWKLIPGIEALDLSPYRVDLTPFASLMNDGRPHRVDVAVRGAEDAMATTATLLAWRDPGRAVLTGAVTRNTLQPSRIRQSVIRKGSRMTDRVITVAAERSGGATGYTIGSRGRTRTRIEQVMRFDNSSRSSGQEREIRQRTMVDTRTVINGPDGRRSARRVERFPLAVGATVDATSTRRSASDVDQGLERDETIRDGRHVIRRATVQRVSPRTVPSERRSLFPDTVESTLFTSIRDSGAGCVERQVTVLGQLVTAVDDGCGGADRGLRKYRTGR